MARVTVAGKTLSTRVWALLADAREAAGLPDGAARVLQGSFNNGGVSASAGTHDGGGAADLSVAGMTTNRALHLVDELRRRNVAAWIRSPEFGWPQPKNVHIHMIVRDEPGLSRGARAQVLAYKLGRNGLAYRRKDPHARPKALPFVLPGDVVVRDLRYGRTNGSVRALQKALRIAQDGRYGPQTDKAVRAHQTKIGMKPDPVGRSYVGPVQARMLGLG